MPAHSLRAVFAPVYVQPESLRVKPCLTEALQVLAVLTRVLGDPPRGNRNADSIA